MSVSKKIDYDLWANQKILEALKQVKEDSVLSESTRLFAHLFKAQIIWFNRIQQVEETTEIWGDYTLEECASLLNDSRCMLEGIARVIDTHCSYINSKGRGYKNSVADIFEHVIIHGEHHWAQILALLSKAGYTPPSTDYIFYARSL